MRAGRRAPAVRRGQRWPLLAGLGAALLVLTVLTGVALRLKTRAGAVLLENVPADAEVFVDGRKIEITAPDRREPVQIEVPEGQHEVKVTTGGQEVVGEQVNVRWGKADPFKVTLGPNGTATGPPRPQGKPGPNAGGKVLAYRHGGGRWRVEGDELIQEDTNAAGPFVLFGDPSWADYDLTVEAQRIEGPALCTVRFRVESLLDFWGFHVRGTSRGLGAVVDGTLRPIQDKGWTADDAWHKIGITVRGEHFQCSMDGDLIFDFADSRHPRGAVGLVSANKGATRFRNLKVTDASGRVLVDGVRSLELAAEEGDPAANDPVKVGTVWRGTLRMNVDGKYRPDEDALLKVRKRQGTRFEGELWRRNETVGRQIEGTMDGLGNVTWKANTILAGNGGAPYVQEVPMMGAVKGKRLRAVGYFRGPENLIAIAEVTVTRDD
jgi:hypothetical protein